MLVGNVFLSVSFSSVKGDPKLKYELGEIYAFEGVDSEFRISFLSFDL